MSEKSHLAEYIDESLLNEEGKFTLVFVDDSGDILNEHEIQTTLKSPYGLDLNKFLPNAEPMNLIRFFEVANELIVDAQQREGIIDDCLVPLVEEYPPDPMADLGQEVIAFRVLKREPAKMNTKGTARPHRKSTFYYDVVSSCSPNKVLVVESRPVDHVIEFSCWAKTNALANRRALWLEKLFVNNAWAFEVQGVERFFWKDRGPDTYMSTGGQRLFYRPVNFFVRFREFEVKAHPILRQINLEIES